MDPTQSIEFIRERLDDGRNRQYGTEPVTELEHALQCAALARQDGADDELVAAALLHDFGRLVAEDYELQDSVEDHGAKGPQDSAPGHGEVGARSLSGLVSERVLFCVGQHAQAKRYLVTTEPAYRDGLSEASMHTLEKQGGLMSADEQAAFETSPWVGDAVRVRRWDDAGKIPGMKTGTLEESLELVRAQLLQ